MSLGHNDKCVMNSRWFQALAKLLGLELESFYGNFFFLKYLNEIFIYET